MNHIGYPKPQRTKVLTVMRNIADPDGIVRSSTRAIAEACGCSHPTVRDAVLDLQARGKIDVFEAAGVGQKWRMRAYRLAGQREVT